MTPISSSRESNGSPSPVTPTSSQSLPAQVRSSCLIWPTAILSSIEERAFVYSVHCIVSSTQNIPRNIWGFNKQMLNQFTQLPPLSDSALSIAAPVSPWFLPQHKSILLLSPFPYRQSSSSRAKQTRLFRVWPPLTHQYHLLSPTPLMPGAH